MNERGAVEARGALRDAVNALQNLYTLLRSSRVSTKLITAILPEIVQSSRGFGASVLSLLDQIALSHEPAALSLVAFSKNRADEAAAAAERAAQTSLDARARLQLEVEMARLVPQLDAARNLAELLEIAAEPSVELDAAELLEAAFTPASQRVLAGPSVQLRLGSLRREQHTLRANPQVAVRLLHVALGALGVPTAGLAVHAQGEQIAIRVDASLSPHGDTVLVRPPLTIQPTADVVSLICARSGLSLALGGPSATLLAPIAAG